jgi:uncharacterized protein (TIGR02466 family)
VTQSADVFAKREIAQFFPTCLWTHELRGHAALNDRLVKELHALRDADKEHDPRNGAWQSGTNLHQMEAFRPLTQAFATATAGVLDFLKSRYERFDVTSCWANINYRGESARVHTHPNNFLSGVYYVRAPKNCGDIVFQDPRRQAVVLIPSVSEWTPYNASTQSITPQEGRLLLFHSWFQHMVEANRSEEERISIAFNVMLRGSVGHTSGRAVF